MGSLKSGPVRTWPGLIALNLLNLSIVLGYVLGAITYTHFSTQSVAISLKHRAERIEHSVKASVQMLSLQGMQLLAWPPPRDTVRSEGQGARGLRIIE
jgi:hypothetical protein